MVGDFGARLQRTRKHQGISLRTLAERSGVSVSQLSRLENGLRRPTMDQVLRISQGLGLAASIWFQTGAETPQRAAENTAHYTPHPTLHDLWQEAHAWLSEEDWQDVRALLSAKVDRQKLRSSGRVGKQRPE